MPRKPPKDQGYRPVSLHAITTEQVDLIDRACAVSGDTRTRFIIDAAVDAARFIVNEAAEEEDE